MSVTWRNAGTLLARETKKEGKDIDLVALVTITCNTTKSHSNQTSMTPLANFTANFHEHLTLTGLYLVGGGGGAGEG